jgi:hypothetical protein
MDHVGQSMSNLYINSLTKEARRMGRLISYRL